MTAKFPVRWDIFVSKEMNERGRRLAEEHYEHATSPLQQLVRTAVQEHLDSLEEPVER